MVWTSATFYADKSYRNPVTDFHSLETQRSSRLVSTARPKEMWTKTGRNSPMAGINKSCGSALTKIGAVANRYTVLLEMISDHDGADDPERGAVRADLFLHCICREQVSPRLFGVVKRGEIKK
jgi:hypothetical protein